MNQPLLNDIKTKVQSGNLPQHHEQFSGAGIVISSDPNCKRGSSDKFVVTQYADQVGWLVSQLKKAYQKHIDSTNKYGFYAMLGDVAIHHLKQGDDVFKLFDLMEDMMKHAESWADEFPELSEQKHDSDEPKP